MSELKNKGKLFNLPKSVVLAVFFGFLIVVFVSFDLAFVNCSNSKIKCQAIDGNLISPNNIEIVNLTDANNALNNIRTEINTRTNAVNIKANEIRSLQNTVSNIERESINATLLSNSGTLATNLNANKSAVGRDVNLSNSELTLLNAEKSKAESKLLETQQNISSRFSIRLLWTVLTATFFVLCVIAFIFSLKIMQKYLTDNFSYYTVNILIPILILIVIWLGSDYSSVFAPIFNNSIFKYGDLSLFSINLFNVFGIGAVFYLMAASCSILYKVEQLKNPPTQSLIETETETETQTETETNTETQIATETGRQNYKSPEIIKKEIDRLELREQNIMSQMEKDSASTSLTDLNNVLDEKSTLEEKLAVYDEPRSYIRWILYIGGTLLFVGLLRINVLNEWHQLFIETEYDKLFKEFSDSALSVQAFFYTILLALIYFPTANAIPDTPDATNLTETFQKNGLLATINEFLPRIIAFIIPLLAKPLADLIELWTNKTTP